MAQPIRSSRVFITEGCTVGRLSVGPLVFNVRDHSLFEQTPISYIKQGRLRECTCSCGTVKLIAEKILERGRVQSCGCLKKERSALAIQKEAKNQQTAEERKKLTREIKSEQNRLQHYMNQYPKDEEIIERITKRVRELMLLRLSTVNFKRNAKERIRRKEKKLLTELNLVPDQEHEP